MDKMIRVSEATGITNDSSNEWFIRLGMTGGVVQVGCMYSGTVYDMYPDLVIEERDSEVHERVEWMMLSAGHDYNQMALMFARLLNYIMDTDDNLRSILAGIVGNMFAFSVTTLHDPSADERNFLEGLGFELIQCEGKDERYSIEIA